MQRQLLRAEEHFGCAQDESIIAAIERVSQDHLHQLMDEEMRKLAGVPDDIEIGGLERAVPREMIAPGNDKLPVLARIGIGDRGDLRRADGLPWVG